MDAIIASSGGLAVQAFRCLPEAEPMLRTVFIFAAQEQAHEPYIKGSFEFPANTF